VVEASGLPYNGTPERCFSHTGSGLIRKHYSKLQRLAMDKQTSILRKSVNYDRKKFYRLGLRIAKRFLLKYLQELDPEM
jgi:hypothetical protein